MTINRKKRQSRLNTGVTGHQRNKTANINWKEEGEPRLQRKILAKETYNTTANIR